MSKRLDEESTVIGKLKKVMGSNAVLVEISLIRKNSELKLSFFAHARLHTYTHKKS